jgi:hypothetical protein
MGKAKKPTAVPAAEGTGLSSRTRGIDPATDGRTPAPPLPTA